MKKILSLTLAIIMLVSAIPSTYAFVDSSLFCVDCYYPTECAICGQCYTCNGGYKCDCVEAPPVNDYTAGTQVTYTADADTNREYSITVPALLNPGQSGTVTLKGKWASNETVKVTADATVELTNSINSNDKKILDVEFPGIVLAGSNTVSVTDTKEVSVADIENALFGTWSGVFEYQVEIVDANLIMFAFCDSADFENATITKILFAEEGMTWAEWLNSEYNTVNAYWQERNSNIYMSIPGEEYEFYVIGNNNVELDGIINNETIYRITCR